MLHIASGDIQIEKPHQSVEIFSLSVQLSIGGGPELGKRNGPGVRISQQIEPGGKIVLPVRRVHAFLELFEHRHRFAILVRGQKAICQLENPIGSLRLVERQPLKDAARAI